MPAGEADVVVELVGGIPAEHHVAEAEAAVERGFEFFAGEIFAAQHAVGIEHAELDVSELALAHDVLGIGRSLDLARLHAAPLHRRPGAEQREGTGTRELRGCHITRVGVDGSGPRLLAGAWFAGRARAPE